MKILYPIGIFYPSQIGGPANAIAWMVKALHQQGVDTTVITTTYGISSGINSKVWLKNQFGNIMYTETKKMDFCWPVFVNSVKKLSGEDIVHLTSVFHFPNLLIYTLSVLLGKKIVWSPGGEFAKSALNFKKTKKIVYLSILKLFCSNRIVYHSSSPQETLDIQRVFGVNSRIFQIPNLIDAPTKIDCPKKKQFLFIGRIHPIKAIENLIEACYLSKTFRDSGYKMIIAGDFENEYGISLVSKVARYDLHGKIEFIGHIEGEMKIKLYAESSFLFLPSHSENFANVVTESLSQGTPVVASTGTPWAVLSEKNAGFWVSNSPSSLSSIIDEIITMKLGDYERYSLNAYSLLHERYEIKSSIHKWIDFYKCLLANQYSKNVYYEM